jgi:hypothetical protein
VKRLRLLVIAGAILGGLIGYLIALFDASMGFMQPPMPSFGWVFLGGALVAVIGALLGHLWGSNSDDIPPYM